MRKIILSGSILAIALLGAPLVSDISKQSEEIISVKENSRANKRMKEQEEAAKEIEDQTRIDTIPLEDASVTPEIVDYNPDNGEFTLNWTFDWEAFSAMLSGPGGDLEGKIPEINRFEFLLVNKAEFESKYPGGAGISSGWVNPSTDPAGWWGNNVADNGMINDWYLNWDSEDDADNSGLNDIVAAAEDPTDTEHTKDNVPVMYIDTSGRTFISRSKSALSGSVRVRNLTPGKTYDGIMVRISAKEKSVLDAADLADEANNNGYWGATYPSTGGNVYITYPTDITPITIPYSPEAVPTFETVIPEGESDWVTYADLDTDDGGATGTVDATLNYSVMEDNDPANSASSKSNIKSAHLSSAKAGIDIDLTEEDYDDVVDTSSAPFTNPYTGVEYEQELPDPEYVRTATEHSLTLPDLAINTTYDDFTLDVSYESNVNALDPGQAEIPGSDPAEYYPVGEGFTIYNEIEEGVGIDNTPIVENMTLNVPTFTTPDLNISPEPTISGQTVSAGTTPQTDLQLDFDITTAGLDSSAYDPVVTKVEITSEVITGGSYDATLDNDGSGKYSVTLPADLTTIEGGQTISDLAVKVTYNEMPSATSKTVTAAFSEYTTADKVTPAAPTLSISTPEAATTTASFTTTVNGLQAADRVNADATMTSGTISIKNNTSGAPITEGFTTTDNGDGTYTTSATGLEASTSYTATATLAWSSDEVAQTEVTATADFTTTAKGDSIIESVTVGNQDVTSNSAVITWSYTPVAGSDTESATDVTSIEIKDATTSYATLTGTDITPTGQHTINDLESNTEYNIEVVVTYDSGATTGAVVSGTTTFTTVASQDLILDGMPATVGAQSGTSVDLTIGYNDDVSSMLSEGSTSQTISYNGTEYATEVKSLDDTKKLVTYTVSGLDEGTVYSTTGWSISGTTTDGTFTTSGDFTTGYIDEAFVNEAYGLNIINNSWAGTSFTAQILFEDELQGIRWMEDLKLTSAGQDFTQENGGLTLGHINVYPGTGYTMATVSVTGMQVGKDYSSWTITSLNPDYLTSARYYGEDQLTTTAVDLNQFPVDPDTGLPIDGNGDPITNPDDLTNVGDILGNIDIDGDGNKDDVVVSWPDGKFTINVDGDNDKVIIVNPDGEGGFTITWPDGVFPDGEGGFIPGGGPSEIIDNGNGSWTIDGLGDIWGDKEGIDVDGDGNKDDILTNFPDGSIEIAIDGDGDKLISINPDGEGGFTVTWPEGVFPAPADGGGTDVPATHNPDGSWTIPGLGNFWGDRENIDADGDGNKDDILVNWPDGKITISIDGDSDKVITINPDGEGGFTVTWPENYPTEGNTGGIDVPAVHNPDGSWTIPGLGDFFGDRESVDVDGDGKDDILVNWPDGKITISIDGDSDKVITINPDGEGGFTVTWPENYPTEGNTGGIDVPVVENPDGSWTIPGLGDLLDTDGDGNFDGIDTDGDGNIDINIDLEGDKLKPGIDTDGDGNIDIELDLDGDNLKPGLDLDGDGNIDIEMDLDGDKIPGGIDTDGDGIPDINIDLDIDSNLPGGVVGFDNEAIVDLDSGLEVIESSITKDSFQVNVEFKGNVNDPMSEEFQSVKFKYEGKELQSKVISGNGKTITYEISGLSSGTEYSKDGWTILALDENYLDDLAARSAATDMYQEFDIRLTKDFKTANASKLWLIILIILLVLAAITIIGLVIFLIIKKKGSKEDSVEETTSKQSKATAKAAKIEVSDNETFMSSMTEAHLKRLAQQIYDPESLKGYKKQDLIDLLVPEDVRHLEEVDHKHQVISKWTKSKLMELAEHVYSHDSLVNYEKDDLIDLIEHDDDIKVD